MDKTSLFRYVGRVIWAERSNHPEENRSPRTGRHPENGPLGARSREQWITMSAIPP